MFQLLGLWYAWTWPLLLFDAKTFLDNYSEVYGAIKSGARETGYRSGQDSRHPTIGCRWHNQWKSWGQPYDYAKACTERSRSGKSESETVIAEKSYNDKTK